MLCIADKTLREDAHSYGAEDVVLTGNPHPARKTRKRVLKL
jgi:hypothetical protein